MGTTERAVVPEYHQTHFFNDKYNAHSRRERSGPEGFPSFGRLSPELRLQIWRHCLPNQRFVGIKISRPIAYHMSHLKYEARYCYKSRNSLGNIVSGYPYELDIPRLGGWPTTLLRVSHEANQAFSSVFRVHLPLQPGNRLLHLNPEGDILHLWAHVLARKDAFAALLHDLVAYDPKGIGVAHIAIGKEINDTIKLASLVPADLPAAAASSITSLLTHSLRTLYAVSSAGSEARGMLGMLSWPRAKIHQNRSFPIAMSGPQSFTFLESDPRPIEQDIAHQAVGMDPRRTIVQWNQFEANFGVRRDGAAPPLPLDVRYAFAWWLDSWSPHEDEREGLARVLRAADEKWADWMRKLKKPPQGERLSDEEYRRLREDLQEVAGVWVFPFETFGPVPRLEDAPATGPGGWEPKMVKDLSQFRPGLMVFDFA